MRNTTPRETALVLLLVIATAVSAQELTQAEKDRALQHLESTKANLLEATKGVSKTQLDFKSSPDRWSIAEVMEQVAASEDVVRDGLVREKVMVSLAGQSDRDVKKTDESSSGNDS